MLFAWAAAKGKIPIEDALKKRNLMGLVGILWA